MLDSVVDVRLLGRGSFDTNCTESRELGFMLPAPRASFLVDVRCLQLSRFLARWTPGFVELESHKTSRVHRMCNSWGATKCWSYGMTSNITSRKR